MIYHFKTLPSTNTYAMLNLETLKDFDVILADYQSAGRGRFNHQFEAENKKALLMSLVIKRNIPLEKMLHLSSLTGLCVVLALKKLNYNIQLKYPNDLIYHEKKCGGILVETKGNSAVIGIGINLHSHPKYYPSSHLEGLDVTVVLNQIVKMVEKKLSLLDDLDTLYKQINLYSFLNGKKIKLNQGKIIQILHVDGKGKIHYKEDTFHKEMYMHEFSMHEG